MNFSALITRVEFLWRSNQALPTASEQQKNKTDVTTDLILRNVMICMWYDRKTVTNSKIKKFIFETGCGCRINNVTSCAKTEGKRKNFPITDETS